MLPRQTAKTTITLYTLVEETMTFHRIVIRDCVWQRKSKSNQQKQGTSIPDYDVVKIAYDPEYISSINNEEFLGVGWTIKMGPETHGTYIVKGDCPYLKPPDVEPGEPENIDDEIIQENKPSLPSLDDFIRDVIIPFEATYDVQKPQAIVEHFYGSRNMWYIEVNC